MALTGTTDFEQRTTGIEGLLVLRTRHVEDERGTVREMYRESVIAALGEQSLHVVRQLNLTYSHRGVIRGLHGERMAKLVGLAAGAGFGAYLDGRPDSPSLGTLVTLDLRPGTQVLVPAGVCNGFQALSEDGCLYLYCFDDEWAPAMPGVSVHPLDIEVAVPWPIEIDPEDRSMLSSKDAGLPSFAQVRSGGG